MTSKLGRAHTGINMMDKSVAGKADMKEGKLEKGCK